MSFEVIERRGIGSKQVSGVAIGVTKDQARKVAVLAIRIAPDVMKEMAWTRNTKVEAALGKLGDEGLLRIATVAHGWSIGSQGKGAKTCRVQIPARWLPVTCESRRCVEAKHSIVDGALLIVLPTFARCKENGGKK